jgi:hypothetical protein
MHVFSRGGRENMLSKGREEEIYPRRELQQICEDRVHTSATTLPEKAGEIQQPAAPHLSWSL